MEGSNKQKIFPGQAEENKNRQNAETAITQNSGVKNQSGLNNKAKTKEEKRNKIIGIVVLVIIVIIAINAFGGNKNNDSDTNNDSTTETVQNSESQQKAEAFYEWFKSDWKAMEETSLQEAISGGFDTTDSEKNLAIIDVVTGFYVDDSNSLKAYADYSKAQTIGASVDEVATEINTSIFVYPEVKSFTFSNFNYASKIWNFEASDINWGDAQSQVDAETEAKEKAESELQSKALINCKAYGESHYYDFDWHTILGLQASEAYQDGWIIKADADYSNIYGASLSGTAECITDSNGNVTSFYIY